MGLKIIVGGQFGGEGKGKVAYWLAKENNIKYTIRIGGSNSGHTVIHNGEKYIFRHLPTPSLLQGHISILAAGTYIDLDVLLDEIKLAGLTGDCLWIDGNAMVVDKSHKDRESDLGLKSNIGSTLSGTGQALISRINRTKNTVLARSCKDLQPYIVNTKEKLRTLIDSGEEVIVEGTQGYGLSILHSDCYPYTTSRDTTAAGFLSEVGLSPFDVDDIYLVIRAHPIRVEGNSGPLNNETTWSAIGVPPEFTSVTKGIRRVAEIDAQLIKKAIASNKPTKIVLNHMDYLDETKVEKFIYELQKLISQEINFVGTGSSCVKSVF